MSFVSKVIRSVPCLGCETRFPFHITAGLWGIYRLLLEASGQCMKFPVWTITYLRSKTRHDRLVRDARRIPLVPLSVFDPRGHHSQRQSCFRYGVDFSVSLPTGFQGMCLQDAEHGTKEAQSSLQCVPELPNRP